MESAASTRRTRNGREAVSPKKWQKKEIKTVMPDVRISEQEGLQDNATRKKGSLLLTRVRAPAASNAVVWSQRAQSPSCYTNL